MNVSAAASAILSLLDKLVHSTSTGCCIKSSELRKNLRDIFEGYDLCYTHESRVSSEADQKTGHHFSTPLEANRRNRNERQQLQRDLCTILVVTGGLVNLAKFDGANLDFHQTAFENRHENNPLINDRAPWDEDNLEELGLNLVIRFLSKLSETRIKTLQEIDINCFHDLGSDLSHKVNFIADEKCINSESECCDGPRIPLDISQNVSYILNGLLTKYKVSASDSARDVVALTAKSLLSEKGIVSKQVDGSNSQKNAQSVGDSFVHRDILSGRILISSEGLPKNEMTYTDPCAQQEIVKWVSCFVIRAALFFLHRYMFRINVCCKSQAERENCGLQSSAKYKDGLLCEVVCGSDEISCRSDGRNSVNCKDQNENCNDENENCSLRLREDKTDFGSFSVPCLDSSNISYFLTIALRVLESMDSHCIRWALQLLRMIFKVSNRQAVQNYSHPIESAFKRIQPILRSDQEYYYDDYLETFICFLKNIRHTHNFLNLLRSLIQQHVIDLRNDEMMCAKFIHHICPMIQTLDAVVFNIIARSSLEICFCCINSANVSIVLKGVQFLWAVRKMTKLCLPLFIMDILAHVVYIISSFELTDKSPSSGSVQRIQNYVDDILHCLNMSDDWKKCLSSFQKEVLKLESDDQISDSLKQRFTNLIQVCIYMDKTSEDRLQN